MSKIKKRKFLTLGLAILLTLGSFAGCNSEPSSNNSAPSSNNPAPSSNNSAPSSNNPEPSSNNPAPSSNNPESRSSCDVPGLKITVSGDAYCSGNKIQANNGEVSFEGDPTQKLESPIVIISIISGHTSVTQIKHIGTIGYVHIVDSYHEVVCTEGWIESTFELLDKSGTLLAETTPFTIQKNGRVSNKEFVSKNLRSSGASGDPTLPIDPIGNCAKTIADCPDPAKRDPSQDRDKPNPQDRDKPNPQDRDKPNPDPVDPNPQPVEPHSQPVEPYSQPVEPPRIFPGL